ncbi:hypothetical protein M0R04_14035 [Candidatus Dojkabacteria bacterium]|jgi:hypothetical protein|nr:hypothetical protein [Candidatus Dojkabacteria bacterium]
MNQFSQEELKNILALIGTAPITGKDALVVALLQQKITGLLIPQPTEVKVEEKKDGETS